jgi:hypothetical protein
MAFKLRRKSTSEMLEYTRWTLRLIEQYPHRDEDAHLARELTISLKRYIAELERSISDPVHSPRRLEATEVASE